MHARMDLSIGIQKTNPFPSFTIWGIDLEPLRSELWMRASTP